MIVQEITVRDTLRYHKLYGEERVEVGGQCRAIMYKDSDGNVSRIDLFNDTAVTDYGNANTVGSFAWALAQIPAYANGGAIIQFNNSSNVYSFSTAISTTQMRGRLWIRGQGIYTTRLQVANNADIDLFTFDPGAIQLWLRFTDLMIDGNKDNQGGDGTHDCLVIDSNSNYASDLFVQNVYIYNFDGDGVRVANVWGGIFENFISEYHAGYGLYITYGPNHLKVYGSKLISNDKEGLYIKHTSGGGDGAIITCSEFGTGDTTGAYHGMIIEDNDVSITNCIFKGGSHADSVGLVINGQDACVVGNVFRGAATSTYCIDVQQASPILTLVGNHFVDYVGTIPVNYSGAGVDRSRLIAIGNNPWNQEVQNYHGVWASKTIDTEKAWNTLYYSTKTDGACTFTLPSAVEGMKITFFKYTDQDVIIQAATGDQINNGTAGKKYKNTTAADEMVATCQINAITDVHWIVTYERGTWANDNS